MYDLQAVFIDFNLTFQQLIPKDTPSQKYYTNKDLILSSYWANDTWYQQCSHITKNLNEHIITLCS
jgi:hypothetical protein